MCECTHILAPGPARYGGEIISMVSFSDLVVAVGWTK